MMSADGILGTQSSGTLTRLGEGVVQKNFPELKPAEEENKGQRHRERMMGKQERACCVQTGVQAADREG
mgnify:CR=1 FL=1